MVGRCARRGFQNTECSVSLADTEQPLGPPSAFISRPLPHWSHASLNVVVLTKRTPRLRLLSHWNQPQRIVLEPPQLVRAIRVQLSKVLGWTRYLTLRERKRVMEFPGHSLTAVVNGANVRRALVVLSVAFTVSMALTTIGIGAQVRRRS